MGSFRAGAVAATATNRDIPRPSRFVVVAISRPLRNEPIATVAALPAVRVGPTREMGVRVLFTSSPPRPFAPSPCRPVASSLRANLHPLLLQPLHAHRHAR